MKKRKIFSGELILLVVIGVIAFLLRGFMIGSAPPSPSLDEVSLGYNAYSILHTGADEYGERFPVLLRAYDDWRPALYVYLVIPFLFIFDLSPTAVRIPSVIMGTATVVMMTLLVKELLALGTVKKSIQENKTLPLLTSLLLAISPWHIYFSRIGHEWNGSFSFLIFGLTAFFAYMNRKRPILLVLSAICLGLSFDFYQSTKIIVPLIIIFLGSIFYKEQLTQKKHILFSLVAGLVIVAPIILVTLSNDSALQRFSGTTIFQTQSFEFQQKQEIALEARAQGDTIWAFINGNKYFHFFITSINAYLSHFKPEWLFMNTGEESFKVPHFGLLYIISLPFILIGLLLIFLSKSISKKVKMFIIFLLLLSPIPASITTGYPHAARVFTILAPLVVLESLGLLGTYYFLKKKLSSRKAYTFAIITGIVYIVLIYKFAQSYFFMFPGELSHQFQYGVVETMQALEDEKEGFSQIHVANNGRLFQSYMFYLFSTKYDPFRYLRAGGTESGGFEEIHLIDNIEFGTISSIKTGDLYVLNHENEYIDKLNVIKTIYNTKNEPILVIAKGK